MENVNLVKSSLSKSARRFWREEQGIGTLEIVLIIAVVVIIFVLFKDFIIETVTKFVKKSENTIDDTFK